MIKLRPLIKKEIRELAEPEFLDLANNSDDAAPYFSYFEYRKSIRCFGLLLNDIPIYAGWIVDSPPGNTTESMLRNGCREKFAFTLYKEVKKKAIEWANDLGRLYVYMNLDGSKESEMVYNWTKRIGYKKESFMEGRHIMVLNPTKE